MRAYYGSRFSKNMTETPEGFLICHSVPVARTGWYEYLGEEIGVEDMRGKIVRVYRSPDEVFSAAAMASFEGKPVTDDHPPEEVTPENATRYTKGVMQNVRQGKGGEDDLLLADLVIHDQALINEVLDGKREVSCGYACTYADNGDGTYSQQKITGNHVAVVTNGRAGTRVSIKDSQQKQNESVKGALTMAKKLALPRKKSTPSLVTNFMAALGFKHFATDAEPEEVMDAIEAMAEERGTPGEEEEEANIPAKDTDPAVQALAEQVAKLTEFMEKLAAAETAEVDPMKEIDNQIAELEKETSDNDEEESHTIPAELIEDEEGPVASEEDRPQSALTGDNAHKIAALRAIKPILAEIKDPAQRKRAADAALASIKSTNSTGAYAKINKAQKKKAADTQTKVVDYSQLGKEIAQKYNPHYQKRA